MNCCLRHLVPSGIAVHRRDKMSPTLFCTLKIIITCVHFQHAVSSCKMSPPRFWSLYWRSCGRDYIMYPRTGTHGRLAWQTEIMSLMRLIYVYKLSWVQSVVKVNFAWFRRCLLVMEHVHNVISWSHSWGTDRRVIANSSSITLHNSPVIPTWEHYVSCRTLMCI